MFRGVETLPGDPGFHDLRVVVILIQTRFLLSGTSWCATKRVLRCWRSFCDAYFLAAYSLPADNTAHRGWRPVLTPPTRAVRVLRARRAIKHTWSDPLALSSVELRLAVVLCQGLPVSTESLALFTPSESLSVLLLPLPIKTEYFSYHSYPKVRKLHCCLFKVLNIGLQNPAYHVSVNIHTVINSLLVIYIYHWFPFLVRSTNFGALKQLFVHLECETEQRSKAPQMKAAKIEQHCRSCTLSSFWLKGSAVVMLIDVDN